MSAFEVLRTSTNTSARVGKLRTRRGCVDTPVFMPVGTQAAVKTVTPQEVAETGAQIILANTYHLMLRPGVELIETAGGVARFMNWDGPILTDSGGFQVFSLAESRKVREDGVEFRSHVDGSKHQLTPESAIDLQLGFGSDVMMPLDELTGYHSHDREQRDAAERTQRWLERAVSHFGQLKATVDGERPLLFGIAQGGFHTERRAEHAARTAEHDVDGFSIGGLSVGESKGEMYEMLEASVSGLPSTHPRYLMGVGSPEDLWNAVAQGVDMFDCVHPTRVARRGAVFTPQGRLNITASRFRDRFEPIMHDCNCYTCQSFTTAYVHHLFRAGEMLGPRLATIHNLRYFQRVMEEIREAIRLDEFESRREAFLSEYESADERVAQEQRARWRQSKSQRFVQNRGG